MSHDHREAIAEVIAAHEDYAITSNWDAAICRCGVKVCDLNDNATDADTPHRAHLADALLGSDALAQIRAEARAEALREAGRAIYDEWPGGTGTDGLVVMWAEDWLEDRAALTAEETDHVA